MAKRKFNPMAPLSAKDIERYFFRVDKSGGPDACWIWTGSMRSGYGQLSIGPLGKRMTFLAHRIGYFLAYGKDPGSLMVCHKCDVPACNNPRHLFLGTYSDNLRDAYSKGLMPTGDAHYWRRHPVYGEKKGSAKLTEADVVKIRELYAYGINRAALSRKYGVCFGSIDCVVKRKTWQHVS